MKIVTLSTVQQAEAAALKNAVTTAQVSFQSAHKALTAYLQTVSTTKSPRVSLTDDGAALVIQ
jgi:cellobiose-specific phosphotransferase system component IIA